MTHKEMFGSAHWLTPAEDVDAAVFSADFETGETENAKITICGLGYFILYINGKRVGTDEFVPVVSDYHARPDMTLIYPLSDKWTHRIYCVEYPVSGYLKTGVNSISVMVGGGFYHQKERTAEGNMNYGKIKLCYKIELGDRTVVSGSDTVYTAAFFKKSNLFTGEILDFTGFGSSNPVEFPEFLTWKKASLCAAPDSEYYVQNAPADRPVEQLPVELVKDFGGYSVYRTVRNVSGYPVVKCDRPGETIIMECAENINSDFTLNNTSVGWGEQRQIEKITSGEGIEEYHPYFCWFGFRYFSLTNNAVPVGVRVIHSDVEVTSDFECSDETLNWYYRTFVNTQLSNMHGSIPSDCPHRERLGYTGDGQLTCDAVMTEMDADGFYRKWIYDICDCQDKNTGHVQHTAPFGGGGGGPAGWGGAVITVPYTHYRHYGDAAVLKETYENMLSFVRYMESRCDGGLVVREEDEGWCLGEWCTPEKVCIPEPLVNTALYISQLEMLKEVQRILNMPTGKTEELIAGHVSAFNGKYRDGCSYLQGVQGADAFSVNCGAAGDETVRILVEKYEKAGEFDTGIFGTPVLLGVLYGSGFGNLATRLLANKKTVSFETMKKAGATTLWENWNGEASHSHPMFGASTKYLFTEILGIKQKDGTYGYDSVEISPCFADTLSFARGYITTAKGKIYVEWERNGDSVAVIITVEADMKAEFRYADICQKLTDGKNRIVVKTGPENRQKKS